MRFANPEGSAAYLLRSAWPVPIATGTVFILLTLVTVSWWDNRFEFQALSGLVEITASTQAVHTIAVRLPGGAELQFSGTHMQDRPPELAQIGDPYNGMRLTADAIVLESVELNPNTVFTLTATGDGSPELRILSGGALRLTLAGNIRQNFDGGVTRQIAIAERPVGFDLRPNGAIVPVRLVLSGAGPLKGISLYDQPIRSLSLTQPRGINGDQRIPFQSDLISGKLKLLDTGDELPLQARELLWLSQVEATVGLLQFGAGSVAVDLSGRALSIGVGPPRLTSPPRPDRNLTPSIFAYLLGQHELKLAWGAAVAILVALWKARQWALKWPEQK